MSAKHRVSQIILLFGYRYRLHQVILGIQGESSCSMSVIKGKSNYTCEIPGCGCNFINPYTGLSILQIHHIDGDATNNKEQNLQVLCPNHHAMTEHFGSRNKNSTRKYRYKK